MLKDLRLSSVLSDNLKTPTPILETVKSLFQMADSMGLGALDLSAVAHCYEQWIDKRITNFSVHNTIAAASETPVDTMSEAIDRRRKERLTLHVPLKLSVYQWEQEGSFTGQLIDGTLRDLSESGIQIASSAPLEKIVYRHPFSAGFGLASGNRTHYSH